MSLALLQVDWASLDHAYGPAADAPGQLLALAGDDPEGRSGAVGYLDAAMLHQGSVFSATAPFMGLATASNPFIYDRDLAPFVRLASRPERKYPPSIDSSANTKSGCGGGCADPEH